MGMTTEQLNVIQCLAENKIAEAKKHAIACCDLDTTKKNQYSVKRYKSMLENNTINDLTVPDNLLGLITIEDVSDFKESRYYIGERLKDTFDHISKLREVSSKLDELGITYLNSTLLYGRPGTGKTLFSRYVAYKLKLPYVYVNFSTVVDSLMGNTSKHIKQIFDYVKTFPCVLMFDEIDCIGLTRGGKSDKGADGELARTTITLMQELDQLTNNQIIIAATNREDRLDEALLRRFYASVWVTKPSKEEASDMIYMFLTDVGLLYSYVDERKVDNFLKEPKTQSECIRFATQIIIDSLFHIDMTEAENNKLT